MDLLVSKQRNLGILLNRKQVHRKRQRTWAISRATCAARASSASCFCFSFASLSSVKPATAWVSLSHSFVGPTLPSLSKNTGRVGFELVLDIELALDRGAGGCGEARPHRSPSHVGKPFSVSSPSLDCIPQTTATRLEALALPRASSDGCEPRVTRMLFPRLAFLINFFRAFAFSGERVFVSSGTRRLITKPSCHFNACYKPTDSLLAFTSCR